MKLKLYIFALIAVAGIVACQQAITPESGQNAASLTPVVEAAEDTSAPVQVEQVQVVETAELMKLLVDPIYEELKDAIENPPEKRRQWRALYIAAFNLAELTNLNFSRHDEDYMTTQDWTDYSVAARDLTIAFAKSVQAQADYPTLKKNYLAVVDNCNDCHTKFEPGEVDKIEVPTSWTENAAAEKEDIPL